MDENERVPPIWLLMPWHWPCWFWAIVGAYCADVLIGGIVAIIEKLRHNHFFKASGLLATLTGKIFSFGVIAMSETQLKASETLVAPAPLPFHFREALA